MKNSWIYSSYFPIPCFYFWSGGTGKAALDKGTFCCLFVPTFKSFFVCVRLTRRENICDLKQHSWTVRAFHSLTCSLCQISQLTDRAEFGTNQALDTLWAKLVRWTVTPCCSGMAKEKQGAEVFRGIIFARLRIRFIEQGIAQPGINLSYFCWQWGDLLLQLLIFFLFACRVLFPLTWSSRHSPVTTPPSPMPVLVSLKGRQAQNAPDPTAPTFCYHLCLYRPFPVTVGVVKTKPGDQLHVSCAV